MNRKRRCDLLTRLLTRGQLPLLSARPLHKLSSDARTWDPAARELAKAAASHRAVILLHGSSQPFSSLLECPKTSSWALFAGHCQQGMEGFVLLLLGSLIRQRHLVSGETTAGL